MTKSAIIKSIKKQWPVVTGSLLMVVVWGGEKFWIANIQERILTYTKLVEEFKYQLTSANNEFQFTEIWRYIHRDDKVEGIAGDAILAAQYDRELEAINLTEKDLIAMQFGTEEEKQIENQRFSRDAELYENSRSKAYVPGEEKYKRLLEKRQKSYTTQGAAGISERIQDGLKNEQDKIERITIYSTILYALGVLFITIYKAKDSIEDTQNEEKENEKYLQLIGMIKSLQHTANEIRNKRK